MVVNIIKKTCLLVALAMIVSVFILGCSAEYELKLAADPEDAGAVSGSCTYAEGEKVAIKAETEEGYTFDRWKVKGTDLEYSDKEMELKVEEEKELVAEFSRKTPTINLECDIEEDTLIGGGTYEYGETVEIEAREIEGYRFKKWLEDDEVVSEDKTYQFAAVENRTLTAVRELETAVRELDLDLERLVLKDDLKGYLLPIRENGKYGLIDTEGEKVVRVSELNCALSAFGSFWDHPGVKPYQVGETDPLILTIDIDGNRKQVAFNEKGQVITTLLREYVAAPQLHYNNYGLIVVEGGRYGFIDFEQNPLLELKYEEVSFIIPFIQERDLLKIKQDGLLGLADSASGDIVIEPQYEDLESTGRAEYEVLKGKMNDQVYLLNLSGEIIKKLDIDEYGLFNKGVCPVKKDGSWGLIDFKGELLVEPVFDNVEVSTGRMSPDAAAARFEDNSRTGYLDSDGEVLFEGEIEETIGNYFIFTEKGKAGIKSIEGEVIKEPAFDNYSKSRPPGTGDPTAGHVAEDYTLFKKDGLWGVFAGGEFLTDFKFEEIGGYWGYWDLPMEFNDVPQIVVKEKGLEGEGLYDLSRGEYIITPGKYGGYLKNPGGFGTYRGPEDDEGFGYLKQNRVLIKKDGKFGFVDRDGREVIEIQYDLATAFENEAAGVIKDEKLSFINREGNQLVEPVGVDYDEDSWFQLDYLEGPNVYEFRYEGVNYSYFDHDGWIRKP